MILEDRVFNFSQSRFDRQLLLQNIFVGSGYSGFRQPAGNVLLAFKPREAVVTVTEQLGPIAQD